MHTLTSAGKQSEVCCCWQSNKHCVNCYFNLVLKRRDCVGRFLDRLDSCPILFDGCIFSIVELAGKGELALCVGECFQGVEIADLALGKPCLFPLSTSATVAQVLRALKYNKDIAVLSVWVERTADELFENSALPKSGGRARDPYRCGALVTILDIICFLASDESLRNPAKALSSPLSFLYPSLSQAVEHVHGGTRLCHALDLMLNGVQHLVVPITKRRKKGKPLKIPVPLTPKDVLADDYCWITQEDVLRYLLGCIGKFYPLPMMSLRELGMINTNVLMVDENAEAITALSLIKRASQEMTAVAVVSEYLKDLRNVEGSRPKLVGDVSIHTMRGCNEMAAEALATLSMKEFLYFVHDSVPPQFLVEKVRSKLNSKALTRNNLSSKHSSTLERDRTTSASPKMTSGIARVDEHLNTMSEFSTTDEELSEYSSSDEELSGTLAGLPLELSSVLSVVKMKSRSLFPKGRALITCRPQSSLVAVTAQALAHRVDHVWITDDEGGLVAYIRYIVQVEVRDGEDNGENFLEVACDPVCGDVNRHLEHSPDIIYESIAGKFVDSWDREMFVAHVFCGISGSGPDHRRLMEPLQAWKS